MVPLQSIISMVTKGHTWYSKNKRTTKVLKRKSTNIKPTKWVLFGDCGRLGGKE